MSDVLSQLHCVFQLLQKRLFENLGGSQPLYRIVQAVCERNVAADGLRKISVRTIFVEKQRVDEKLKDHALIMDEEGTFPLDSIFELGKRAKPVRGCFVEELAKKVGLYVNVMVNVDK